MIGVNILNPLSAVTLAVQDLDRSKNDKDTVIDIYKALGFENGWVEAMEIIMEMSSIDLIKSVIYTNTQ